MKKHRIMLMTAALLASQAMWAQQKNLSGTVVDSQVRGAKPNVEGAEMKERMGKSLIIGS